MLGHGQSQGTPYTRSSVHLAPPPTPKPTTQRQQGHQQHPCHQIQCLLFFPNNFSFPGICDISCPISVLLVSSRPAHTHSSVMLLRARALGFFPSASLLPPVMLWCSQIP